MALIEIGVFIPIGSNGWLISTNAPQYMPSFELDKQIVQKTEEYSLDFTTLMIKLRGLVARLSSGITTSNLLHWWRASLQSRPRSAVHVNGYSDAFASCSNGYGYWIHCPWMLRNEHRNWMTDGVRDLPSWPRKIDTDFLHREYCQMSIWPGNAYFGYRHDYATEYMKMMKEYGQTVSEFSTENNSQWTASSHWRHQKKIVAASESGHSMEFVPDVVDFNFAMGSGISTPSVITGTNQRLVEATAKTGRDGGVYVLFMAIADDTDEPVEPKWQEYREWVRVDALAWMVDQGGKDTHADENVKVLDEVAEILETKGIVLTFDVMKGGFKV
jgi:pyrimidine oxygenase